MWVMKYFPSLPLRVFLISLFALVFTGCVSEKNNENETVQQKKEVQAVQEEGVVSPLEVIENELGTHLLVTRSGKKYILRSQIVDLSDFEDFLVTITGEMTEEQNEKVITVFAVDVKQSRPELRQSVFTESDFGISFTLPGNWQRLEVSKEKLEYFPEGSAPVITVERIPMRTKEGVSAQEIMVTGTSVLVSGKNARRIVKNGGEVDIFVMLPEKSNILVFSLTPQGSPSEERSIFYSLLSEISWTSAETEILSEEISDYMVGVRCGGVAKLLCPSGYRCELESITPDSTGVCVDASLAPSVVTKILSRSPETTDSDKPSLTPFSVPKEETPTGWLRYNRDSFAFSFAIPRSWWWRGVSGDGEVLARTEIGPEEIASDNWAITIEILPKSLSDARQEIHTDTILFLLPRDDKTHFVISGKIEYAEITKDVASSLSLLSSS